MDNEGAGTDLQKHYWISRTDVVVLKPEAWLIRNSKHARKQYAERTSIKYPLQCGICRMLYTIDLEHTNCKGIIG